MNIISDNHLHSSFSSDSNASSESMIQKALKLGLTSMCFTEHNDYDYPPEDGKIVFKIDFDSYFDTLSGLREKYRSQIDIRIGIEQGLMASVSSKVDAFDSDSRLAMTAAIRQVFAESPAEFDPRKYLGPARDNMKKLYIHKIINVLGSDGKAL